MPEPQLLHSYFANAFYSLMVKADVQYIFNGPQTDCSGWPKVQVKSCISQNDFPIIQYVNAFSIKMNNAVSHWSRNWPCPIMPVVTDTPLKSSKPVLQSRLNSSKLTEPRPLVTVSSLKSPTCLLVWLHLFSSDLYTSLSLWLSSWLWPRSPPKAAFSDCLCAPHPVPQASGAQGWAAAG